MKIYIMARKETRVSSWSNREEVDSIETSFNYEKLLKNAEQSLTEMNEENEEWKIDLKKLTAIKDDGISITKLEIVIKSIEI